MSQFTDFKVADIGLAGWGHREIAIAEKVQAAQGWGAWPACTAKLGLR